MKAKIPSKVRDELDATGLPWSTEWGGRHLKIRLAGRFAGVCHATTKGSGRHDANHCADIRRLAREIKGG